MKLRIPFLLSLAFAHPCLAQSDDRAADIINAWRQWANVGGTSASTITVLRNGELVREASIGIPADTSLPLASLSKAITAACMDKLSEAGRISLDETLGDLIELSGPMRSTTVAQLLTNTSGIWPDSTQGNPNLQRVETEQIDAVTRVAISRNEQMGEIGTYAYNNENYAILGAVVQEVTGEAYEDFCSNAVLAPLGIASANLTGKWAAHGSWGGWSMSASDYASFAWATFGPASKVGATPEDWPSIELGSGTNFGMGTLWRRMNERHLFWFSGMLCWDGNGDGGYFASYGGEWLVVTLYSDCLDGTERLNDLDLALFKASLR